MKDMARLQATFEYIGGGDDFEIGVSGAAQLKSGPASWTEFVATGNLGVRGGEPTFGVFLAKAGSDAIPIVPGTVDLMGAGGGFFYRPQARHLQRVYDALGDDVRINNPNGLPDANDLAFAILLYADVGVGGSGGSNGVYTMRGNGLVTVTDQFFNVDLNGHVMPRPPNQESELRAGAYLTVEYGGDAKAVRGGLNVDINYVGPTPILATRDGQPIRMDFAYVNDGSNETWFVDGRGSVQVMRMVSLDGAILASPDGFLAQVSASASLSAGIVEAKGRIGVDFWYNNAASEVGAYAEIRAEASVLGGLAEVSADMRGALIASSDSYLIYAGASARVKVMFVFDGSIDLWMALENGSTRGGTGRNARYEAIVADSRALLGKTKQAAEAAQQTASLALANADLKPPPARDTGEAQGDATQFVSSTAEIEAAAETLARDADQRRQAANLIEPTGTAAADRVLAEVYRSDAPRIDSERMDWATGWEQELVANIDAGRSDYDATVGELRLRLQAIQAAMQAPELAGSPVSLGADAQSFTLDESLGDAQQEVMDAYQSEIQQIGVTYADRLAEMEVALEEVADLLDGPSGAAGYVSRYNGALSSLASSIRTQDTEVGRWLGDLNTWRSTRLDLLTGAQAAVQSALLDTIAARDPRENAPSDCCMQSADGTLVYANGTPVGDLEVYGKAYPPVQADAWGDEIDPQTDAQRDARADGAVKARRLTNQSGRHRALIRTLAVSSRVPSSAEIATQRCAIESKVGLWGRDKTSCPGTFGTASEAIAQNAAKQFRPNAVTVDFPTVRALAYEETSALYTSLPQRMVERAAELSAATAPDIASQYRANLAEITDPYTRLTATVDSLYTQRAQLTENLAGMYDQYAVYLTEQGERGQADEMLTRRQSLLQQMRPPKLTGWTIRVDRTTDRSARAEGALVQATWEQSDAVGRAGVIEILKDDVRQWRGMVMNGYRGEADAQYYVMPSDSSDTQADVTVSVALRSQAGALFPARERSVTVALNPRQPIAEATRVTDGCPEGATCGSIDVRRDETVKEEAAYILSVGAPLRRSSGAVWVTDWNRIPVEVRVFNPSGRILDLSYHWVQAETDRADGSWTVECYARCYNRFDPAQRIFQPGSTVQRDDVTILRGDLPIPSNLTDVTSRYGGLKPAFLIETQTGRAQSWRGVTAKLDETLPTPENAAAGWRMWWTRSGPALQASLPAGAQPGQRAGAFGAGESVIVERVAAVVDPAGPWGTASGADSAAAWVSSSPDPGFADPDAMFGPAGGTSEPVRTPGGRVYLYGAVSDVAGNVQPAASVVTRTFGLPQPFEVAVEPGSPAVVSVTRPDDGWRLAGYQIACRDQLGDRLSGEGAAESWRYDASLGSGSGGATHTLADTLSGRRAGGAAAFEVPAWPCALYVRPVYDAPGAEPTVFAHRTVLADATPPDLIVARVAAPSDGQTRLSVQASDAESGLKSLRYRTRSRSGGALSAWTSVPGFRSDADSRRADSLIVALDSNPTEIAVEAVSWGGTRAQRIVETTDASAPLFSARVAPLTGAGTGVRIAVDGLTDPQTGVDRLEYRFRLDGQDMMWSNWASVPLPVADGAASVAAAFEVEWPETDRIDRLSVRATNGDGLARDTTLDLRLLDFSLPLYTIDRLRVTRGRADLEVFLRGCAGS